MRYTKAVFAIANGGQNASEMDHVPRFGTVASALLGITKQMAAIIEGSRFPGQFGGWNLKSKDEACIVAMWEDEIHYQHFMNQQHDKIVRHNDQMNTYESIDVSLLIPTYDMPGCRESMTASLQEACALRIADCFVKPEREAHFVEMQHGIWIPNMCKADGMLAGVFSKVEQKPSRYMVTTLWKSIEAHDKYAEDMVPSLRKKSQVTDDLEHTVGGIVSLNADWLVLPN